MTALTLKYPKPKTFDSSPLIYGKVLPQASELEDAVIAAVLIDSACLANVINLISEDVFYKEANQRIFKACVNLYDHNRKVDILTVCEELRRTEDLDIVGGPYAITKLTNAIVSSANVEDHCRIMLQKYMSREMIRVSGEGMHEAYEDSVDIFELYDRIDSELIAVQEKVMGGSVKDMMFYVSQVHHEYETVKETGILGIQTNLKPLDSMFCGLVAPDLIIIAARPAAGKTALVLSITHEISVLQGIPGAWFSLEMDGSQLTRRLVSIHSGIPHEDIRRGQIPDEHKQKFLSSMEAVGKAPIYIEDNASINIRRIRTRATILVRKKKVKYIVVDYLQLMEGISQNRENAISEISRGLKQLAKELKVPVIALSQLSRKVEERPDKMPQLSDLRESGAIEQDADAVIFLMRPQYYGFTEDVNISGIDYSVNGLCVGKGAKNRHGQCGNFPLHFNGPCMHFTTHYRDELQNGNNIRGTDIPIPENDFEKF